MRGNGGGRRVKRGGDGGCWCGRGERRGGWLVTGVVKGSERGEKGEGEGGKGD